MPVTLEVCAAMRSEAETAVGGAVSCVARAVVEAAGAVNDALPRFMVYSSNCSFGTPLLGGHSQGAKRVINYPNLPIIALNRDLPVRH